LGDIFTPYTSKQRSLEPRAILALEKTRGIEELILGWVLDNRALAILPTLVTAENLAKASQLQVIFSRAARRVGAGALHLDSLLPFLPPLSSITAALDAAHNPLEAWFDKRNAELGIELDLDFDLNRCPPRSLSPLILSYLLNPGTVCSVRAVDLNSTNEQIKIELVYIPSIQNDIKSGSSKGSGANGNGWKETFLVNRKALENFVPHIYWV